MDANKISINKKVLTEELSYNGTVLMTYTIEYPEFRASVFQLCLSMINAYYHTKALEMQRTCRTELFDLAVEQYRDDIQNHYPVRVFEAMLVYKVTYSSACIISLYFDRYQFTGGAHGTTTRYAQTWNLQKCAKVRLNELIVCQTGLKETVLNAVIQQIERSPELYFDKYMELVRETFNENSFYCTKKGITIFFQQYDIAPYSSGIREFLLPYSECVTDPQKLCFVS